MNMDGTLCIMYLSQYLVGIADPIVQIGHLIKCEASEMHKNNIIITYNIITVGNTSP
jgi:hypothetical protein